MYMYDLFGQPPKMFISPHGALLAKTLGTPEINFCNDFGVDSSDRSTSSMATQTPLFRIHTLISRQRDKEKRMIKKCNEIEHFRLENIIG